MKHTILSKIIVLTCACVGLGMAPASQAAHFSTFLDSLDAAINKVRWEKIVLWGQTLQNHEQERTWALPSLLSLYDPIEFGGTRINPSVGYNKVFKSKKTLRINADASYGIRNKDVNGSLSIERMYNPFNRGFFRLSVSRDFEAIYEGDAWINQLKRSNFYLANGIGVGHGLELLNGLFLYSDVDFAFRRSVADYKTNPRIDSLFGNILENNHAIAFPSYNAE